MKGIARNIMMVAIATVFVLGLGSCAKGSSGATNVPRQTVRPGQLPSRQPLSSGDQAKQATAGKPAPAPSPAPQPVLPPGPAAPTSPRYLNLLAPPVALLPADFSIGALQGLGAAPSPKLPEGLLPCLTSFLDGLVAGKTADAGILKGRKALLDAITGELPPVGKPGHPLSWRLGAVKAEGTEAVAAISLFAATIDASGGERLPPRGDGVLHARLVDSLWFVEDLSFDAATLLADRNLPNPPWEPQGIGMMTN